MANTFFISDTHFGHIGVCKFMRDDGVTKLRPWTTPEEMDEALISNWNRVVGPKDKVYHLGDVVINRRALHTLHRLNGEKVLIKGNHDIFRLEEYTPFFKDVRGYHVLDGMILSHIPIHPESLARFSVNVHGHLHSNRVLSNKSIDPQYFNVSVEQINYTPIAIEDMRQAIMAQGGNFTMKERAMRM